MMNDFSAETRASNLQLLKSGAVEFDLVIIGGGINGAGVARDAASRGMKVALIEATDYAEGTSSRSSKLIHGGIRYLENLEFGLVFEALNERSILFEMAPYLVHPLRFMLPLYDGFRVGMFKMGLGMWLYDMLAMFDAPQMHERLGPEQSLERMPVLLADGLLGSYVYSDAYMDDDRLVIETLRSANEHGAVCVNHVRAIGSAMNESGQLTAIRCRDEKSGEEFSLKGKHFVSTVGPWTDELAHTVLGQWDNILRPSKGIHLTLRRDRLPLSSAVVMAADQEKRIVFGIPRHEMIILGTTDTDFKSDPAKVHSERSDVDYLLGVVDQYFPGAKITEQDVIASYSGVRPLVNDGSSSEGKTSREHVIISDERNMTLVAGGKYTTYRHMAQQTVDAALAHFPLESRVQYRSSDTRRPLNKKAVMDSFLRCEMAERQWAEESGESVELVRFLCERHGEEAEEILQSYSDELRGAKASGKATNKIEDRQKRWLYEARHALRHTMCMNLKDFYLRRTPLFLAEADHGWGLREMLADTFTENLGWRDAERQEQIGALQAHLEFEMGWRQRS